MNSSSVLSIMLPAFAECLVLVGIHSYLGLHVIKRRVIFVDLALAQIAALGATVGFAAALSPISGIPFAPIVLAFSPGGLAEMSLIALALGIETAFVATHHVARIAMIVIAAPLVFRKLRAKAPEHPEA